VKVAFGLKAHSGWAALVALGSDRGDLVVADRARLVLAEEDGSEWARQPYHAAEGLLPAKARDLVEKAIAASRDLARRELRSATNRAQESGHEVVACAVLVGSGMPDWSVEEILAVHFRMHQAEGELFRDVLVRAARACRLELLEIPEKRLAAEAERALRIPAARLAKEVSALGKSVGPPWGKDQKDAALAALVALRSRGS
jgi:hypothetical protein